MIDRAKPLFCPFVGQARWIGVRWADIACQPVVLQRELGANFSGIAHSRHLTCQKAPFKGAPLQRLGAAAQTGFAGSGFKPFQ